MLSRTAKEGSCRKGPKLGHTIRVGLFSSYFPEHRDGVFARLSQDKDLDFTFLAGSPRVGSYIKASTSKLYRYRPIRVFAIPILRTKNFVTYRCGAVWALLRRKYDVLILANDILGLEAWICCLLSRLLRVPVCIWGQGLSRPPSRFRDILRFVLTSLSTAALYYTDEGRDYWIKRGIPKKKLFVAYNALDTDAQIKIRARTSQEELAAYLNAEGLDGKKIFVFLGRLIAAKKPRVFIDAVARAATHNPAIFGIMIGDGPVRYALEQYVLDQALTNHIRFIGAIYDESTIAKILMSSTAMLLPAFAGLAIEHAAVYGVPVILGDVAHSHGPEQAIVEDGKTGLRCPDEDLDAFATAILQLAGDSKFRESLSVNIRREIDEKYNVYCMAQGFIDAVHYCISKRSLGEGSLSVRLRRNAINMLGASVGLLTKAPCGLRILTFHEASEDGQHGDAISKAQFAEFLSLIEDEGYVTIRARDLLAEWPKLLSQERIVLLTFDDGYAAHRDIVADLLTKRGMTATFFVLTMFLAKTRSSVIFSQHEQTFLCHEDLRLLSQAGFELGSHSHTHPLSGTVSPYQFYHEARRSRDILAEVLGYQVESFAYPYGRERAYTTTTRRILERIGYKIAFTQAETGLSVSSDLLELPRVGINRYDNVKTLRRKLHGGYELIGRIRKYVRAN